MKRLYLIVLPLFLSVGISQNKVNVNNLVQYGDKWFKENDDKPYTGLVFDLYRTTGNKSLEGRYKDGLMTDWYENGQKEYEGTFKDGEWISRECWDEDGNECECGYHGRCK